jgi:MYXO-CTERM domain-containing protein
MSIGMKKSVLVAFVAGVAASLAAAGAQAQSYSAGSGSGSIGGTVAIDVTLGTGGLDVASGQVDLGYDPAIVRIPATSACSVNPAINKGATSFALRPSGCSGDACTSVRAAIIAFDNADLIPDNTVVFTCTFNLVAEGTSDLTISGGIVSNPDGDETDATGNDGSLSVVPAPTHTNTPEVPTATNTPTRTNTPPPTNTAAPTNTRSGGGNDDDDGCQVVAPANSSAGWLLLIPAAALLWQRRRRSR